MIGDDANIVFIEFLKQLLEIIRNMSSNRNSYPKEKNKTPKQPKIKFGSLSKKDFDKLKRAGLDFKYVTLPREKLAELENTAKDIGGSFFATQLTEGNNAVIAVPSQYINEVNAALKHIAAEQMKDDPTSLLIKDGTKKISAEDMGLTANVLRSHDIPVYSFKSSDGTYMNVVPKEFNRQYEAAIKESIDLKNQLAGIEVTRYDQTAPLDNLDRIAEKLSYEEAQEVYAAVSQDGLDVKFAQYENSVIALYSPQLAEAVKKARDEYQSSLAESEKYLIDVTDDTITMDVAKLVVEEDNNTYFVRVPNTAALDYLRINKSDVELINGGKTISMKLDMEKEYKIYDENKILKSSRTGSELAKSYNTKYLHANKDTEIYQSGNNFRRIDLYNEEQNRLISLGINNAGEIRTELLKQGISPKAADKLLKDINNKLPDNYKEIFNYSHETAEIVYADIPNIGEYLAQSQLSQQVIGKAECHGEIPKDNGSKCCVFDKNANQFTIMPIQSRLEVIATLTEMGYSELSAKEIADRVIGSYRKEDFENIEETVQKQEETVTKTFDSKNPELKDFMYHTTADSIVIVQEIEDTYKYMEIDKGISMSDVETALLKGFDIKDEMSAAEIIRELNKENIIDVPQPVTVESVTVTALSTNYVEIRKDDNAALMPKSKIDGAKLSDLGLSDDEKATIIKSLGISEEAAQNPKKLTLQGLKSFVHKVREIGSTEKGNPTEQTKAVPTAQER